MRYPDEDLWKVAIVLTVGGIILLIFISLIINAQVNIAYVTSGNIFNKSFTEPFEILYLVLYNGDWYGISTHDENKIAVDAHYIKRFLEKRGKKLEDVAIMAHNHFAAPRLSDGNSLFMKKLRGLGFKGSYCIYVTSSRKVVCNRLPDN